MIAAILTFLSGPVARELRGAYADRLAAANDAERIAAEQRIAAIEAARGIAAIEAADRWSATSLGRYLIVVPFGLWWALIFVDSIFAASWDILALPPAIMTMAQILVPAIVIADAGALSVRRIAGRGV